MKYFTKEVKIAIVAIVGLVVLFLGMNFLKGLDLFSSESKYYISFKDISGLSSSCPIYADGYQVGVVRNIQYDYGQTKDIIVEASINKDMRIPKGSSAEIVSDLMGNVKVNLLLANNMRERINPGETIVGGINDGAMGQMKDLIPIVQKMLPKLDSIMDNLNRLTGDPALKHTLANAEAMTGDLRKTAARLDQMMQGDIPQMLGRFNRASANLETLSARLADVDVAATMSSVNQTLDSAQQLIGKLDTKMSSKDNTLGLFLNDRSVYENLDATLAHADSLMIDLKAHPKRYVHFSVFGKKDK